MYRQFVSQHFDNLIDYLITNKSPTTEDFELPYSYLEVAYRQIAEQAGVSFKNPPKVKTLILTSLVNQSRDDIAKLCDYDDFAWHWFDECVRLCQEHQLTSSTFYGNLPKTPPMPSLDNKDSLSLLTVAQIKSLLKKHGHQTTGKRDELVDRLWIFLPIHDTEVLLNTKYAELYQRYRTQFIRHKYNTLMSTIKRRAYFLRKLVNYKALETNPFFAKKQIILQSFAYHENQVQDAQLAKLLDGTGYDTVLINGILHKLLPLFPYDSSWLKFE